MEASSIEDGDDEINEDEGSLNETANSVHLQTAERDKEMSSINSYLIRFIMDQLEVGIKFDNLDQHKYIRQNQTQVIKHNPGIYFLPHTILFRNQNVNMEQLQEKIQSIKSAHRIFQFDREKKELKVQVHSESQMLFYNIRCLKTDASLHRHPKLLDSKHLIDKLYEFYEHFYHKLYFKETMILVLYWAYQKDLLEHVISEAALKLLVICTFINFGYGVNNTICIESEKKQRIAEFKRMNSYARMNARGQTEIMKELSTQFENYTIQEKRGFYMASKKRFMQIRDIVPINFPLFPLSPSQQAHYQQEIDKNIRCVLEKTRENMSICKNLVKLFKFLHNKFTKQMRFVVDFEEKVAYRHQFSEIFQLEVMHPVLTTSSVCRLKESPMKSLRLQISHVHKLFSQGHDPIDSIRKMLQKSRQ